MNDAVSIRTLRRRWKPHKERLSANGSPQGTLIRFHRACSWLARVEQMSDTADSDLALVSMWIAYNSLYGQWDDARREPKPDRECWRTFTDRVLRLDQDGCVAAMLQEHKRLVMSLLEDEYLCSSFWQNPAQKGFGPSKRAKRAAQAWYVENRWTKILDELLERVYLLRCQLVHGAATYGGQLNRTSLRHCVWMLRHLISAYLSVWIDRGADEDWGPMCYPPQTSQRQTAIVSRSTRKVPK